MNWQDGRLGSGYSKLTLFSSELLEADAYIIRIPQGVSIPPHYDKVHGKRHFRLNVTLWGSMKMSTEKPCFRIGSWFSFFRPDIIKHWAKPAPKTTYIFSIGWLRRYNSP